MSLLLATLPMLLRATSIGDGRAVVEEFYRRCNSSRSADLFFVLDSSSSVSRKLWISMITFVKVATEHFFLPFYACPPQTFYLILCIST